jgi:hypothetical protein
LAQTKKGLRSSKGKKPTDGPAPAPGEDIPSSLATTALVRKNRRAIEDLWLVFNKERQDLAKHYLSTEKAVLIYLLGFHLPNVARAYGSFLRLEQRYPQMGDFLRSLGEHRDSRKNKTANHLPKVPPQEKQASKRPILWTDYGCGTGAMAQATLYWLKRHLPHHQVKVELTDLSSHLLNAAQNLLESDPALKNIMVKTRRFGLEALHLPSDSAKNPPSDDQEPFYGLSFGYLWNELVRNPKARSKVIQVLTHHLERRHDTLVLIVEPATEQHARSAMALRDQLTQLGYHALYPCPQGSGLCPMNAPKKDWCFGEFIWDQPPECRQLDKLLGSDRKYLATASYLFASPQLWQKLKIAPNSLQKVVVGRPTIKSPGKRPPAPEDFEYLLCTGKSLSKKPSQVARQQNSKIPAESQKKNPAIDTPTENSPLSYLMRGTLFGETPLETTNSKRV